DQIEDQHLFRGPAGPGNARGRGAVSRPKQKRDAGQPRAQGVLASVPGWDGQDPAGSGRQSGGWEMKYLALLAALISTSALPQSVKVGELNSYKVFPAFLEPYKKGWEMALEEINASGGLLGRKLEVVSRDDGGTPGDAVRVAEELLTRERATV